MLHLRTVHWKVLWGNQNGSLAIFRENPLLEPWFFEEMAFFSKQQVTWDFWEDLRGVYYKERVEDKLSS